MPDLEFWPPGSKPRPFIVHLVRRRTALGRGAKESRGRPAPPLRSAPPPAPLRARRTTMIRLSLSLLPPRVAGDGGGAKAGGWRRLPRLRPRPSARPGEQNKKEVSSPAAGERARGVLRSPAESAVWSSPGPAAIRSPDTLPLPGIRWPTAQRGRGRLQGALHQLGTA